MLKDLDEAEIFTMTTSVPERESSPAPSSLETSPWLSGLLPYTPQTCRQTEKIFEVRYSMHVQATEWSIEYSYEKTAEITV